MIIFYACDLVGRAVRIWDKDAWLRQLGLGVVRRDMVLLCGREDHAQVSTIAAFQGGWD